MDAIILAKKSKAWNEVAAILSGPRSRRINLNLGEISKISKDGETIVVPGKILSQGEIDKKIKIVAFGFSENARKKIIDSKSEAVSIFNEINKNPAAKGIRILK